MRRAALALLLVLVAGMAARAETTPGAAAPASCLADDKNGLDAANLFARTMGAAKPADGEPTAPPPATGAQPGAQAGAQPTPAQRAAVGGWVLRPRSQIGISGRYIEVMVQPPLGGQRVEWHTLEIIAAARPSGPAGQRAPAPVFARFLRDGNGRVLEEGGMAALRVDLPPLGDLGASAASANPREHWIFVVAVCSVDKERMVGWANYDIATGSPWLIAGGTAIVLILLLALTVIAGTIAHRQLLERAWRAGPRAEERPDPPLGWRIMRMVNPVVLTQTSSGDASLGRFQILVFTFVVLGVLLVVYFSTFSIPVLSGDILALLGITTLGSFGARVAANSGSVSTPNVSWLSGKGIIDRRTSLPGVTDLLIADGEIDLTRVQALFFTLLVCFSLVLSGTADLAGFTVPAQTMQLLGLSQLTYVAGKAIAPEAVRRLNSEIDALRAAERLTIEQRARSAALGATEGLDPPARLAEETRLRDGLAQAGARWTDARSAAEITLESVYGDRFRPERLRTAEP